MHLAVRTIDFDYPLPEELIADRPLPDRSASRMMVIHRDTGMIEHRHFCDLPEYVREGDHFILNDTRVVPARYFSNDGSIEIVRAEVLNPLLWKCMVRPGRKMKLGRTVAVGEAVGTVEGIDEEGYRLIRFDREVDEEKYGRLALPHYMNRESDPSDRERYQTVYARHEGAIAAPTAGLHFTPELLASVPHDFLTLHVGVGTFRPVKADRIEDHQMHTEHFFLPEAAARAVNNARRVIAVGTTSVRVLEHVGNGGRSAVEGVFRFNEHLHLSSLQLQGGGRPDHEFPFAAEHAADACQRLCGQGAGHESLSGSHPGTVQIFLLWRLHVDFVRSRRFFQVSFGKSADGFKDCLREGAAGGGTAAERRPGKNWSSGFF